MLRYRGDIAVDWTTEPDVAQLIVAFQGPVTALAIVEDEPTGGVLTLFLYADGSVADEWQASLEDALAALEESTEFDELPWAYLAPD